MIAAGIGFAAVILMVFLRIPIAFAMALVGTVGFALLNDWAPAFSLVGLTARTTAESYELSVVPLFILMGNFVSRSGLSSELYAASHAFLGHRRGGLAMATIVACGGFSAICGSSLATAATMAKVAMPSMRRYGYANSLATGSIAAGGTLGILIPPSVILVIYALITRTSVTKLFAAGILPGVLGVLCYLAAVRFMIWRNPSLGPAAERTGWRGRLQALRHIWGVIVLFVVVIGGIYAGVFTPTEAAGIGAFGGFLFALARHSLNWRILFEILAETATTTAMLFFVLIGALIFANFINDAQMPQELAKLITGLNVPPLTVILVILLIYLVLGCVFESLSMLLLTVPVFVPLVQGLGFDLIWFGIVVVVVTEISLITPPIGMNVFIIKGIAPDVPLGSIYRGVLPFVLAQIILIAIIVGFPEIALWLPGTMG